MENTQPNHQRAADRVSQQESDAVLRALKCQGGAWVETPNSGSYTNFSRDHMTQKLDQVYQAVRDETDADIASLNHAYGRSQSFIENTFDNYEGNGDAVEVDRAFIVPMRASRHSESPYAGEWEAFYPLLSDSFGVSNAMAMRAIYGLPPAILDTYTKGQGEGERGALVLAPVFADMPNDLAPDSDSQEQQRCLAAATGEILESTARFSHEKLGAGVIGLGATLPGVTYFGKTLRRGEGMEDLTTTTGHGGTVFMIAKTIDKLTKETSVESQGTIGVIGGAGSIGWASINTIFSEMPGHTIHAYDKKEAKLAKLIARSGMGESVSVALNAREVLESNNIVAVAATGQIDLDDEEYAGLDLSGKVIVDDSQPGCFDINQVESRGGRLIWVVGEDVSDSRFVVRDGYYTDGKPSNYGDSSGLYGDASEFACGQEAAVIAKKGDPGLAITSPVTPGDVQRIGELFSEYGIQVAPFQAFGRPVEIK